MHIDDSTGRRRQQKSADKKKDETNDRDRGIISSRWNIFLKNSEEANLWIYVFPVILQTQHM